MSNMNLIKSLAFVFGIIAVIGSAFAANAVITSSVSGNTLTYSCLSSTPSGVGTTCAWSGAVSGIHTGGTKTLSSGSYQICLRYTDPSGNQDSTCKDVNTGSGSVGSNPDGLAPEVSVSASPSSGCGPIEVRVLANAYDGNLGLLQSTQLSYGDGSSDSCNQGSPSCPIRDNTRQMNLDLRHTYISPGTYTVRYTATNVWGQTSSDSTTVAVNSCSSPQPNPNPSQSCSDGDGDDKYSRGTVTVRENGHITDQFTDTCTGNTVTEYLCSGNTYTSQTMSCSYGCSAGRCIDAPDIIENAFCSDSDGGKDYYERGLVESRDSHGNYNNERDYCIGNTVVEYSCSGDSRATTSYFCDGACVDGRCVDSGDPQSFCGNNICEAGETSYNCFQDCGSHGGPICSNGICESGENSFTCYSDCGSFSENQCGVEIDDVDISPSNPDVGDDVEIEARVRNTGNKQANIRVTLDSDSFFFGESQTKTMRGGEAETFRFVINDIEEEDEDIQLEAFGCDGTRDSHTEDLGVDDELECKVDIVELDVDPNPAEIDEDVTVNVEVKNRGEEGDILLNLFFEDELVDSKTRFLETSEIKDFVFTLQDVDESGDVRAEALTCGGIKDSRNQFLQVGENGLRVIVINDDDDRDNNRVSGATVKIDHKDSSFQKIHSTDGTGLTVFENIPAGEYEIAVSKSRLETAFANVNIPEEGFEEVLIVTKEKEEGDLIIIVIDQEGDNVPDADVRIRGEVNDNAVTGTTGNVRFKDIPEDEYDVIVSKRGFSTENVRVDVDDGRTVEKTVVLDRTEDFGFHNVHIRKMLFDESIARGDEVAFRVIVKNEGDVIERNVQVTLNVFGIEKVSSSIDLDVGQEREVRFSVKVPSDALFEEDVVAEAGNRDNFDSLVSPIFVGDGIASLIIDPSSVIVGERINVFGHIAVESSADLFLDDEFLQRVTAKENNEYFTSFSARESGTFRVVLKGNSFTLSEVLKVVPEIDVTLVRAREIASTGEEFEVCGRVSAPSAGDVRVTLFADNRAISEKVVDIQSEQDVCFNVDFSEAGEKVLKIRAEQNGISDEEVSDIGILSVHEEILIIPEDLMARRGGDAIFKVVLSNFDNTRKTYILDVEEDEAFSVSVPVKESTLAQGESKTLFVHINPHRLGTYDIPVRVSVNGEVVREIEVDLFVGAREFGFFESIGRFFSGLVISSGAAVVVAVLGLLALLIIVPALYFVFLRSRTLEANY